MLHESWNVMWSRCTNQFIILQKICIEILFKCVCCCFAFFFLLISTLKWNEKTMAQGYTSNKTFISTGENMFSAGHQSKLSMMVVSSFDLSVLTWGQQSLSLSGKTHPTTPPTSHPTAWGKVLKSHSGSTNFKSRPNEWRLVTPAHYQQLNW